MSLIVSPAGRRYGLLPSKPDHRDFGLASFAQLSTEVLPPLTDLEQWCGPVKDQGNLGACTAFAGCGMREFLYRKYTPYEKNMIAAPVFSPMFLYWKEREFDGSLSEGDTGSTGRSACNVLNGAGVCLETGDPYNPSNFQTAPTPEQIAEAAKFTAGSYHRVYAVQDIKSCLTSGYALVLGFTVFESFEENIGSDGMMPVPNKKTEQVLGGHETLIIGYDDEKSALKVRNSWGKGWGASGNFYMPYSVAADSDVFMDAWIQHLGGPWGSTKIS